MFEGFESYSAALINKLITHNACPDNLITINFDDSIVLIKSKMRF